jgi:Superfamily II DNA helicase
MSQKLPETADEMLQISHVTKANFEKYGEGLLKICQQHAADKKGEVLYCNVTACLLLLIWLSI